MIVSPPFLPPRAAGQTDDDWLAVAMRQPDARLADTGAPEGSFPLSHSLAWHNGVHLQAPRDGDAYLPVRAIADGVVVFASAPRRRNDDPDDPQNYDPFCDRAVCRSATWTDNGCMIVRHDTTIGARRQQDREARVRRDVETRLVFFSVYMHLSALAKVTPPGDGRPRDLAAGDRLLRKDEIGHPGRVYGHDGQIHFEICLDRENLQQLIGRAPEWAEPPAPGSTAASAPVGDGRTDCVFGDLYVYLPAGTPVAFQATMPGPNCDAVADEALREPIWVRIGYERGACHVQALDVAGSPLGPSTDDPDGEYRLYEDATARHDALPEDLRLRSSPSGWFELLRFGRNLGRGDDADEKDPLPANVPHWRRVALDDRRRAWVDLNARGSFKFSDADFLPVAGWNFIDDDTTPNDQRCDSDRLKRLIRVPDACSGQPMDPPQLARRLSDGSVRRMLRRVFCRFPSEWDRGTVATRYAFIRELPGFRDRPDAWTRFEAHARTMSFDGLPAEFLQAQWRGHPVEWIEHVRRCRWFDQIEMLQLVPMNVIRKPGRHDSNAEGWWESPNIRSAVSTMHLARIPLNRALRKFKIDTPCRQACFFGNAVQETAWFSSLEESAGRQPTLHSGWYGRGFLQLTNPNGVLADGNNNYYRYFRFLGRAPTIPAGTRESSWRDEVATDHGHAAQSAGAYWVWSGKSRPSAARPGLPDVGNVNRLADRAAENQRRTLATNHGVKVWYYNQSFADCAAAVNLPASVGQNPPGAMNGLVDRSVAFANALVVVDDVPVFVHGDGVARSLPENYARRRLP